MTYRGTIEVDESEFAISAFPSAARVVVTPDFDELYVEGDSAEEYTVVEVRRPVTELVTSRSTATPAVFHEGLVEIEVVCAVE